MLANQLDKMPEDPADQLDYPDFFNCFTTNEIC